MVPELVIHLRAGDLLNPTNPREDANSKKGRMAPCTFLDKVLEDSQDQGFERIRAITEPDRKHPCLPIFIEHGAIVQSESVAAVACAFMNAKHLAFSAKSTFSEALSLFNPNPVTLYEPNGCHHMHTTDMCPSGQGRTIKYCIDDTDVARTDEKKMYWVMQQPRKRIHKEGMQCFD